MSLFTYRDERDDEEFTRRERQRAEELTAAGFADGQRTERQRAAELCRRMAAEQESEAANDPDGGDVYTHAAAMLEEAAKRLVGG